MSALEPKGGKARQAARLHPIEPGELRAVMLTVGVVALFLYFIRSIMLPFVLAGIIAYICTPLINWLTERTRLPRALFAALMFVALIGVAALFVTIAGRRLVAEVQSTAADLQQTIENLVHQTTGGQPVSWFGQPIDPEQLGPVLLARARDWLGQPDRIGLVAGYSIAAVMGTFLTAALLCYFLVGGQSIPRGLLWTVPPRRRALVAHIAARIDPLLKRYFVGMLAIVIYAMVAAYIGLGLVLGIDHALLLAVLTGILETIPIIGSTAAAVIAGLVSLHTATGVTSILAFAGYAVVLRLSIDQIIGPLVLGSAAHVHPVVIIFCFFAGAVLLGIPGVILAVPVALAIKTSLATLYGDDAA